MGQPLGGQMIITSSFGRYDWQNAFLQSPCFSHPPAWIAKKANGHVGDNSERDKGVYLDLLKVVRRSRSSARAYERVLGAETAIVATGNVVINDRGS